MSAQETEWCSCGHDRRDHAMSMPTGCARVCLRFDCPCTDFVLSVVTETIATGVVPAPAAPAAVDLPSIGDLLRRCLPAVYELHEHAPCAGCCAGSSDPRKCSLIRDLEAALEVRP